MLTDRLLSSIAFDMRDRLGDWIINRLRRGVETQGKAAQHVVDECNIPIDELRKEWKAQKETQSSVHARKPCFDWIPFFS